MMLNYLGQEVPKSSILDRLWPWRRDVRDSKKDLEKNVEEPENNLEASETTVSSLAQEVRNSPGQSQTSINQPDAQIQEEIIFPIQSQETAAREEQPSKKDIISNGSAISWHQWTMTHSFYAAMGGYAVDDSDSNLKFMPRFNPRLTLGREELAILCETDISLLPNLSESQIRDKSKASGLAKTLVCIQATWFCVQCIFRLSQNLTICLLELNTFAHALCALLIYVLWWNKPLDVEEPSLLSGLHKDSFAYGLGYSIERNLQFVSRGFQGPRRVPLATSIRNRYAIFEFETSPAGKNHGASLASSLIIRKGERIHNWVFRGYTFTGILDGTYPLRPFMVDEVDVSLDSVLSLQLALLGNARAIWPKWNTFSKISNRVRNWPPTDFIEVFFLESTDSARLLVGFTFAGLVYGGLHLCAWGAFFGTQAQLDLWHISSLILSGSGVMVILLSLLDWACSSLEDTKNKVLEYIASGLFFTFLFLTACFCLVYVFARVYIVVECFLNVAHLPPSALRIPTWSQYIPHIG
jgi:hypothetical protein